MGIDSVASRLQDGTRESLVKRLLFHIYAIQTVIHRDSRARKIYEIRLNLTIKHFHWVLFVLLRNLELSLVAGDFLECPGSLSLFAFGTIGSGAFLSRWSSDFFVYASVLIQILFFSFNFLINHLNVDQHLVLMFNFPNLLDFLLDFCFNSYLFIFVKV